MNRKRRAKNESEEQNGSLSLVKSLGKAVGITLAVCFGLLFAVSLILTFTKDPLALTAYAGGFIGVACSFLCGYLTCKCNHEKWLLCGVLAELSLSAIYFLVSLCFKGTGEPYWILRAICLLFSLLGAYLALRTPAKKRLRRRKQIK